MKRITITLLLLLAGIASAGLVRPANVALHLSGRIPPPSGGGGIELVSYGSYTNSGGSYGGYSTSAIDTSGANLLVYVWAATSSPQNFTSSYFSDSKSNTWTFLPIEIDGGSYFVGIAYSYGSPTVGTNHTMDFSGGFSSYSSAVLFAFSGAATNPFDTNTQNSNSGQPGSITPAEANEVFVTGVRCYNCTLTIDGDFTTVLAENGAGIAYYISDNSNAVNPTWESSAIIGSAMAAFKAE